MKVRDVMTRPVVSTTAAASLRDVIILLTEHGFSAVPVVDDQDRVIGIISESDALRASATSATLLTAAAVMTAPVEVVAPGTDVAVVAEHMLTLHLRCVPVVDNGVLIGVVGRRDLLRMLVRGDDVIAAHLRALLADYSGNRLRWQVEVDDGNVTVSGPFQDEAERRVVRALARTVPGSREVRLRATDQRAAISGASSV